MSCVNTSLKEFRDCCKRLNVSPTTLEPIIHEYINTEGNEESFPLDAYIEERIHGKSVEVLEEAQVQLWETKYSQPKVFNTQEEALDYYNECNKFFPKKSIGIKETLDGKYEVRVAETIHTNELETEISNDTFYEGENISSKGSSRFNLTSDTKLNIWFGSGENDAQRENEHLSNFAERPFTIDTSLNHEIANSVGLLNLYGDDVKAPTVEHAFQLAKLAFLPEELLTEFGSNTTINKLEKQILNSSAAEAKKIGRTLPLTKEGIELWDKHSSTIMKALIKASFEQNPDALNSLLATRNATLTHTQDKGKWGKEFPKLLMEVREELRNKYNAEDDDVNVEFYSDAAKVSIESQEEINEEDLTQEEIDDKNNRKLELDAIFQHTLNLTEQIKEIQNSKLITTNELTELANDIAYYMSDLITQWQENPSDFAKSAPELASKIDIRTLSRAEFIQAITVPKFIEVVKSALFDKEYFDEETMEKADLLSANFDVVLRFGASAFNSVEDFNLNYSEIGYTIKENSEDNTTDSMSNEEQSVIEELGDKQEHWQIDARTIDNFLTMSQAVKRELTRCYQLKEDGSVESNIFGINKRISPRDATSSILRWTQGSLTLLDMISKLEEKASSNYWITPIITKLKDNSGKYADFQSQFFGVFCKHFQEYYIVKEFNEGGTKIQRIMPVNRDPALKEVMTSINVLYKLQAHPLFDSKGVNKTAFNEFKKAADLFQELVRKPYNEIDITRISKGAALISKMLGFDTTKELVELAINEDSIKEMAKSLNSIVTNLEKGLNKDNYNPFTYKADEDGIRGYLSDFLKPLTEVLEDTAISSFFESGKMYQSYILPSYMTKLTRKIQNSNEKEFKKFMAEEYGQYEWFRDQTKDIEDSTSWKNAWLRDLYFMTNSNRKKLFGHKVQLSYKGHNYMRNMSDAEYVLAVMTEFFSGSNDSKETMVPTWYKIPMMSNKPSLEFIKFVRYKGIGYDDTIIENMIDVFLQELDRIITVHNRAYSKEDSRHIKNFDVNGKKFQFLDWLNDSSNEEFNSLLNRKINSTEDNKLTIPEENKLLDLARKEIADYMKDRVNNIISSYKSSGIFDAAKNIDGIGKSDKEIESNLRNFIWNDTFASMMILQMTITDIAYYANAEDMQKRLAQIHAPGIRGNIYATDYGEFDEVGRKTREAQRVCDGNLRAIFLNDLEGEDVKQNILENLEIAFGRKIDRAKQQKNNSEELYWKETRDSIIKAFKDINVTDAQAYNSPTSYRKKALMFGKWNQRCEDAYQKLRRGEVVEDIETVFQPLKPFVYTNSTKDSGVNSKLKVGMQFKNAEYALIMADAIIQSEDTGIPNILRVIYDVMEESADYTISYVDGKKVKTPRADRTKGIDTFMFASAVKAGLHGRLDITNFKDANEAREYLEKRIYQSDGVDGYNETYVHTHPAEDYCIQQDYSSHFLDHSQVAGSQERAIIPSDLEYYDYLGNSVVYSYTHSDGTVESWTPDEFRKDYENTISKGIEDSIEALVKELALNETDKKLRNIALSEVLQREILSSPRYGIDLYFACSVNSDGEFNIPLGDPIQSKRIEQLINSIVKNRVNKQKIAGGPIIQVSNFGMSRRLNIKFKDKEGKLLDTLSEWLNKEENKEKDVKDYKDFLNNNQAGIAYYECYAPASMQSIFEAFMDEKGNIDIEAISEIEPEALEMIGFRIPTEDAYSIAPLRIVGFVPKESGETIVMPYEVTVIWGSDKNRCFYPTK